METTIMITAYENPKLHVVTIHEDLEESGTRKFTVRGMGETKREFDSFEEVRILEETLLRSGYSRYTIYNHSVKRDIIKRRVQARLNNKDYGIK